MKQWNRIADANLRHVWSNEDGSNIVTVDPSFYADSGTPIDADTGEDLCYVRTEIGSPDTLEALREALRAVCPNGSIERDNYNQIVFYTDLQETKECLGELDLD